ncbi:MAG: hypothetical protein KAS67_00415 [Thermoplasmata archaeon]|nr:hypothetical protein [Thermoplasmata archaeon]
MAAQDASGTWTSRIAGEGMIIETYYADYHYDVRLVLNQNGNAVSGTIETTCSNVDINVAGWESALEAVGTSETSSVSGTVSGTSLTLVISGSEGTLILSLTVIGDRMTGSGEYTYPATQSSIDYIVNLEGGSSGGDDGSSSYDGGSSSGDEGTGLPDMDFLAPLAATLGFFGGLVGLGASSRPSPRLSNLRQAGHTRRPPQIYSRQLGGGGTTYSEPGDARMSDEGQPYGYPISSEGAKPISGVGVHTPSRLDSNGNPRPPRDYPGDASEHPWCGICGNARLQAHYTLKDGDPGSWYCPNCKTYPYGKSPGVD